MSLVSLSFVPRVVGIHEYLKQHLWLKAAPKASGEILGEWFKGQHLTKADKRPKVSQTLFMQGVSCFITAIPSISHCFFFLSPPLCCCPASAFVPRMRWAQRNAQDSSPWVCLQRGRAAPLCSTKAAESPGAGIQIAVSC